MSSTKIASTNRPTSSLSIDAQVRIRDELHSMQIGLNLLRSEMLRGDLGGADLTYATLQHCLARLSNDEVLAIDPSIHDEQHLARSTRDGSLRELRLTANAGEVQNSF